MNLIKFVLYVYKKKLKITFHSLKKLNNCLITKLVRSKFIGSENHEEEEKYTHIKCR